MTTSINIEPANGMFYATAISGHRTESATSTTPHGAALAVLDLFYDGKITSSVAAIGELAPVVVVEKIEERIEREEKVIEAQKATARATEEEQKLEAIRISEELIKAAQDKQEQKMAEEKRAAAETVAAEEVNP